MNWNEYFWYDPQHGDLIWKVERRSRKVKGTEAGHLNANGYIQVKLGEKLYRAHRIAWELYHGKEIPEGMVIDHINGDRSDNRIYNLRCVTHSENAQNQCAEYVYWKPNGSWQARPKGINLGTFPTKKLALKAVENYQKKCGI